MTKPVAFFASVVLVATLLVPARAQNCGDCNGDMVATITDALLAAQHAAALITLTSPSFDLCNVSGDLGGPGSPGNPQITIIDALTLAQFAAGLFPSVMCVSQPVVSAGPFDLRITNEPVEVESGERFELTVNLFVQGSSQPAIPATPILVTLTRSAGTGTLTGSTRQWMTSESMVFGNLIYGPVEVVSVRASAGAPHTDDVSAAMACRNQMAPDLRSSVITAAAIGNVRFNFFANGVRTNVTGDVDWTLTDVAAGSVIGSGAVAVAAASSVDVPAGTAPANGLYRIDASLRGTQTTATHALVRGATSAVYFPTLATGHVGTSYTDAITTYVPGTFTNFLVLADQLPPGLTLSPGATGTISGTPTRPGYYLVTAFGINASFNVTRIPLAIAVFSWRDTEIQTGLDFSVMGPLAVSSFDHPSASGTYTFTNSFTCEMNTTRARFYHPTAIQTLPRLPAICFIHGNGFQWDEYDNIFTVVASYGYVAGSCNNVGYPSGTCTYCGGAGSSTYGFARATGFQNSVYEKFEQFDADPTSPFYRHVDLDNMFWSGHSRGGATSLLNIQSNFLPHKVRGSIPIYPVDQKGQTCLGLPNSIPPVPVLNFSAERDGDVVWPIAENPMEDAILTGHDTHVTVYGANHNYTGDTHAAEAAATITAAQQQARIRGWITMFVQRHAAGDLRTESALYLDEMTSSTNFAVFGRRNTSGRVIIDDHQSGTSATNNTGGANSATIFTVSETNTHPSGYAYGRNPLHRRLNWASGSGTNTWAAPVGTPINAARLTHVAFRARQYDSTAVGGTGSGNWQSWISAFTVTLVDGAGTSSTVNLTARMPVSGTPSPSQQRFHRFAINLEEFVTATPAFDPTSIQSVAINLTRTGASTRYVAIDDVRLE